MTLIKRMLTVVACAMAALAASAQTTKFVDVVLECENAPRHIVVVFDGEPMQATRIGDTNRWRGDRAHSFDAKNHIASVRLGGARTACARSRAYRTPGTDQHSAEFTFKCVQQRIWPRLQIDATPLDLPLTYARVIPGSIRCDETAPIGGTGVLADVAPGQEMLYLHPGDRVPRYYEQYFVRIAPGTFRNRLAGSPTLTIGSKDVVDDLAIRQGRNSPNARDLARKDLDKTGFKTVVLKVQ